MEEAFDALERGERALADKLSRRAAEEGHVNPRIWHDRARVASSLGDEESAELALRQAIALAPGYFEAHADLGRLLSRHGRMRGARRALSAALARCGHDPRIRAVLEEELAAIPAEEVEEIRRVPATVSEPGPKAPTSRTSRVDWVEVEAELTTRGVVRLARFLDPGLLRTLTPAPPRSPRPLALPSPAAAETPGSGAVVHYPPKPLPAGFEALRAELFESLVDLAFRFEQRFDRPAEFPRSWAAMAAADPSSRLDAGFAWLDAEHAHGPLRVSPSRPDFPFRFVAALAVPPDAIVVHQLIDLRPGRKQHGVEVELREGDLAITCARRRIVSVGGIDGLQEVAHRTCLVGASQACVLFSAFGGLG